ncbi:metal-binding protein ZinT [Yersinia aldovae]|uniref:metal-binding protein ZinT n=1 Tax=Yersinia aldovae TaxID=29483 RepID=UPI0005AC4DC3|nr:metal-binding protein ZinT [Yersinia aldovae]AJJ62778.1 yodA lipocalin-like domain protein [Yersinia aldovae 670-83]
MLRKHSHLSLITLGLCATVISFNLSAHGKHGHEHQQSDAMRKASEGIFEDNNVIDRALSDWDCVWQSINPYLLKGDLDPVLINKSKKNKDKTAEEYREYYKKGYATDINMIGIENNTIDFHTAESVSSCQYTYSGFKIMHYDSGKKGVRYLFECKDVNSKAPKYVQFSDHIIEPQKSHHFHIYMSNESQEKLLKEMDNWPTFYPISLDKDDIIHEMSHH